MGFGNFHLGNFVNAGIGGIEWAFVRSLTHGPENGKMLGGMGSVYTGLLQKGEETADLKQELSKCIA